MKAKKTAPALALLATGLLLNGGAMAQGYAGVSYGSIEYSDEDIPDFDLGSINAKIGTKLNDFIALEFRAGVGVSDDSIEQRIDLLGTRVEGDFEVELDKFYGLYVKGGVPITDGVFPYIVVGYTDITLDAKFEGTVDSPINGINNDTISESDSESDSDFSYGVGVDLKLTEQMFLTGEFIRLFDDDDAEIDMLAIGLGFKF